MERRSRSASDGTPAESSLLTTRWVIAFLFLLATVAVFGASLGNEFVWDDVIVIRQDHTLRSLAALPKLLVLPYLNAEAGLYRPLAPITWCLNFVFGGESPWSFHVVNLLLHAINAWLVCVVVKRFGGHRWCAWWAGVWFLILPIHTEAVVPIVGRSELLAATWSLITLLLLLRPARASAMSGWRCLGIGAAFLLALLSKEHALALVPLYLWWVLTQARDGGRPLARAVWEARRQWLWLGFALGLYGALRLIALGPFTAAGDTMVTIVENPLAFLPAIQRYLTAVAIAGVYALKSLWPVSLSSDYGYDQIPAATSVLDPHVLIGLGVLGWLVWMTVQPLIRPMSGRRLWHVAAAFLLWFFLPVSNFFILTGTNMGERLMYLPSVGLCLMLAIWTVRVTSRRTAHGLPRAAAGWLAVLGVVGFYGWRSAARTLDWRSEQTLLASAARASPDSVRVRTDQATRWLLQGDDARAERELLEVLRLCPAYFHAVHNLGLVYQAQQRYALAEQQFWRALQLVPRETRVYQNLALLYVDQGREDQAVEVLGFCYGPRPALVRTALRRMRQRRALEKVPSLLYSDSSWRR